jgi:Phosphoribosyl-ATP pyrophosphohydrolase
MDSAHEHWPSTRARYQAVHGPVPAAAVVEGLFDAFELECLGELTEDAERNKLIVLCENFVREEGDVRELADVVYVAFYAAEAFGIPLQKVFRQVDRGPT